MGCDMVRSKEKGKHWDQLHEEGVYEKTFIGPLYTIMHLV